MPQVSVGPFTVWTQERATVTLKSGEKIEGFVSLYPDDVVKDGVLKLEPEFGRGDHHQVLVEEIASITRRQK